jgi:hypothetical protein
MSVALDERLRRLGINCKPGTFRTPAVATRSTSVRGDRYLSNIELATFIEIAKTPPVEDLARLLKGSGARTTPDPYLGGSFG